MNTKKGKPETLRIREIGKGKPIVFFFTTAGPAITIAASIAYKFIKKHI